MKYGEAITYKGKTFLYINIIRRTEDDAIEAMREYQIEWLNRPDVLVLWDFTGTPMSTALIAIGKEIAQDQLNFRQKTGAPARPSVIVGASTLGRTIAANIAEADVVYYAPDLESGKEWLYNHS